ncbi:MAG TPA: hypothetical protein ENI93_05540 [Gammaproteobacteria bacterium]|nr:hypothetical protein [Gammaproteobacteria bacterium]
MNTFPGIGVQVNFAPADRLSDNVLALLHEIAGLLERLVDTGESGSIDLRGLPLLPGERDALKTVLGEGEVRATLDALGETAIHETRLAGVWWVSHCDRNGEQIAEFIEVTRVPVILQSDSRDVRDAGEVLRAQLAEWTALPDAEEEA